MAFPARRCRRVVFGLGLTFLIYIATNWQDAVLAEPASDAPAAVATESAPAATRTYVNWLTRINDPQPLLADYPEYVQPVVENRRFLAPPLIVEEGADLSVRAWRFSYNASGIVEVPNHIRADRTAVIMVHPWGIDDGQGWRTPEPAGVADFCTVEKNHLAGRHTADVINPLLKRLRPHVNLVLFSMRAAEHPAHKPVYRTVRYRPTPEEREEGIKELRRILNEFDYQGDPIPSVIKLSEEHPVEDYFRQFPGIDASPKYNNDGFWNLPVPVCSDVDVELDDVVYYDADGYEGLKDFLKEQGVRHVLLTGYATDMCFCATTAGYLNLSRDFNVFLVGDATLATFPANNTPRYATNAHISYASLNHFITQCSWIRLDEATASK